jgi:hypothetical protein
MMGDLLLPGGGPMRFPTRHEPDPDDDLGKFIVCADCETHILLGDEEVCPICRKAYCEECIEDHDCGFLQAQAEASFL